jgi:predicted P-loop ATPase
MNKDIITQKEAAAEEFFEDFFSGCGGVDLCLWLKHGKESGTRWKENSQDGRRAAAGEAVELADQYEVYFGVCPVKDSAAIVRSRGKKARATIGDIAAVPALWADIDLAGEGHKSGKNYAPDIDAWEPTFEALPPSYIIQSGHGLHCYWLLEKPFQIESEEDRERIGETVKRFQSSLAASAGYDIDTTSDLARVLRVPGTVNHKEGEALPVEIIKKTGARYELADLVSFHAGGVDQEREPEQLPEELPETLPPARKKKRTLKQALSYCRRGKSAAVFARLYDDGDISEYGNDLSRALQALANIVSPRCENDEALTLELVQSSALWGINVDKHGEKDALRKVRLAYKKAVETSRPKAGAAGSESAGETSTHKSGYHWPDVKANWKNELVPVSCSFRNVLYLMETKGITIKYDELKKKVVFGGRDRKDHFSSADLSTVNDETALSYIRLQCHKAGLNISQAEIREAVRSISDLARFNPVKDWLREARAAYNGEDMIGKLYGRLHLSAGQNEALCKTLFRKWLISAARLAFNEGTRGASGILILCGDQGIGKTRFVQSLVPFPDWVKDGVAVDPAQKDDVLRVMKYWIVELGEIGQTLRREKRDRLKAFFTSPMDSIRRPYGKTTEEIPRTTAFIGTVNMELDNGFLTDSTGSRRFWPIRVDSIEDAPEDFDLFQLWGQVMAAAEMETEYLTRDELAAVLRQNIEYDKISSEEKIILDRLDWSTPVIAWRRITAAALAEELNIQSNHVGRVGRALVHIAKTNEEVIVPTNNHDRRYRLPPKLVTEDFYSFMETAKTAETEGGRR